MSQQFDNFDTQIQSDEHRLADDWDEVQRIRMAEAEAADIEELEAAANMWDDLRTHEDVEVPHPPECDWCHNESVGMVLSNHQHYSACEFHGRQLENNNMKFTHYEDMEP